MDFMDIDDGQINLSIEGLSPNQLDELLEKVLRDYHDNDKMGYNVEVSEILHAAVSPDAELKPITFISISVPGDYLKESRELLISEIEDFLKTSSDDPSRTGPVRVLKR